MVLVHEVLSNSCALCFPIEPYTFDTVVDAVTSDYNVDSCMKFDSRGFRAAELFGIADVMNVTVFDNGEHSAHSADNIRAAERVGKYSCDRFDL